MNCNRPGHHSACPPAPSAAQTFNPAYRPATITRSISLLQFAASVVTFHHIDAGGKKLGRSGVLLSSPSEGFRRVSMMVVHGQICVTTLSSDVTVFLSAPVHLGQTRTLMFACSGKRRGLTARDGDSSLPVSRQVMASDTNTPLCYLSPVVAVGACFAPRHLVRCFTLGESIIHFLTDMN